MVWCCACVCVYRVFLLLALERGIYATSICYCSMSTFPPISINNLKLSYRMPKEHKSSFSPSSSEQSVKRCEISVAASRARAIMTGCAVDENVLAQAAALSFYALISHH